MKGTLDGFCNALTARLRMGGRLGPETVAEMFVAHFGVSVRPELAELERLLAQAGFGEVSAKVMAGLKGLHYGAPQGRYAIHYHSDLGDGAREHTVLHEAYEIIRETMRDLTGDGPLRRSICGEADRFAAAVLMQPAPFAQAAVEVGLDVAALRQRFGCSYASTAIRLTEALWTWPLMAVVYEREGSGLLAGPSPDAPLRASVAARTPAFGRPRSRLLNGNQRGLPIRGGAPPVGSLAHAAMEAGSGVLNHDPVLSAAARPVFFGRKLAKIVVVAVPARNCMDLVPGGAPPAADA